MFPIWLHSIKYIYMYVGYIQILVRYYWWLLPDLYVKISNKYTLSRINIGNALKKPVSHKAEVGTGLLGCYHALPGIPANNIKLSACLAVHLVSILNIGLCLSTPWVPPTPSPSQNRPLPSHPVANVPVVSAPFVSCLSLIKGCPTRE